MEMLTDRVSRGMILFYSSLLKKLTSITLTISLTVGPAGSNTSFIDTVHTLMYVRVVRGTVQKNT